MPGIVAKIVLIVGTNLTVTAVMREKELGTFEQIVVTPVRNFERIQGKTFPLVVTVRASISGQMLLACDWFAVPFRGSVATLCLGILRVIFLKGAGLDVPWPQCAILVVLAAAVFLLGVSRFHERLGQEVSSPVSQVPLTESHLVSTPGRRGAARLPGIFQSPIVK